MDPDALGGFAAGSQLTTDPHGSCLKRLQPAPRFQWCRAVQGVGDGGQPQTSRGLPGARIARYALEAQASRNAPPFGASRTDPLVFGAVTGKGASKMTYQHLVISRGRYQLVALTDDAQYSIGDRANYAVLTDSGARVRQDMSLEEARAYLDLLVDQGNARSVDHQPAGLKLKR